LPAFAAGILRDTTGKQLKNLLQKDFYKVFLGVVHFVTGISFGLVASYKIFAMSSSEPYRSIKKRNDSG
jgi:hypothetical protein